MFIEFRHLQTVFITFINDGEIRKASPNEIFEYGAQGFEYKTLATRILRYESKRSSSKLKRITLKVSEYNRSLNYTSGELSLLGKTCDL